MHGSLIASLFTTLFGRTMQAMHVEQTLNFKKAVLVEAEITAKVEVTAVEKRAKNDLVTCKTTVTLSDGTVAVDGIGKVVVMHR